MKPMAQLLAGQMLPRTWHRLLTCNSQPCFPSPHTAASPPTCSCTSCSLRRSRGLVSIRQQLAMISPSMRQPSTYYVLQQGAPQITRLTVLNLPLTNFDASQFLYKYLPCMAHGPHCNPLGQPSRRLECPRQPGLSCTEATALL